MVRKTGAWDDFHYDIQYPTAINKKTTNDVFIKTRSKRGLKGKYISNRSSDHFGWVQYMVDSGFYGKDSVCVATSDIHYEYTNATLEAQESHLWSITQCPYKMVVIHISITFGNDPVSHANLLLVNKSSIPWEVERFEPQGSMPKWIPKKLGLDRDEDIMDLTLENHFHKILDPLNVPFVYKRPSETCPYLGPQARAEFLRLKDGFCQIWTFFYMDARLSNPSATAEQIQQALKKIDRKVLYELIQDFVHFVYENPVTKEYEDFYYSRMTLSKFHNEVLEKYRRLLPPDQVTKLSYLTYMLISKMKTDETRSVIFNILSIVEEALQYGTVSLSFLFTILKKLQNVDLAREDMYLILGDMMKLIRAESKEEASEIAARIHELIPRA
jgi:hypothetical protein